MIIEDFEIVNKGKMRARFSVVLPSAIKIRGCALFTGAKGDWVNFPSRKTADEAGAVKWIPVVEIVDKARAAQFKLAVLAALRSFQEGNFTPPRTAPAPAAPPARTSPPAILTTSRAASPAPRGTIQPESKGRSEPDWTKEQIDF